MIKLEPARKWADLMLSKSLGVTPERAARMIQVDRLAVVRAVRRHEESLGYTGSLLNDRQVLAAITAEEPTDDR